MRMMPPFAPVAAAESRAMPRSAETLVFRKA